ncbi:MAG: ABC transporter substrate-binding protein [Syntrophomonadaceae bacterium]|jgi:ABC-type nitrate/sulfonate/bicarbonate transport system substrate-binding protein
MKKNLPLIIITLLFLFLVVGCNDSQTRPDESQDKVSIILDWVPNTNHTGLYVAQDQGFFADEGIEVEILNPGEAGAAQLIAAGQGDFGISYQEEVTIARSQGIPIVAIAAVIQHNTSGFASPADRNIQTPADFENKTYGGWGSPAETAVLKALMAKHQADFGKINLVNIGDADFFVSLEKDIDFAWIYYGWTGIEAELKNMDLNFIKLRDEHEALDFYTPVIIASEQTIAEKPELVKKFLKAVAKGYSFAIEKPDEAARILLSRVPELDQDLVIASQNYLAKEYQADAPRWGEMKPEIWKKYSDFMYDNGLIERSIEVEKAFTNYFLP